MLSYPLTRWMVLLFIISTPLACIAQGDMFLEIPGIPGEATQVKFENQIVISSFSWGTETQPQDFTGGGGGSPPPATLCPIRLSKWVDKSSPLLFRAVTLQQPFDDMKLSFTRSGGPSGEKIVYLEYLFRDVIITLYDAGGAEDSIVEEVIAIHPARIEVKYYPQKLDGSLDTPVTYWYDYRTRTSG